MKGRLERYAVGRTITEIDRVAIDSLRLRLDQDIIFEVSAHRPYRGADAQVRVEFYQDEDAVEVTMDRLSVKQLLRERQRLEREIALLIDGFQNKTQIPVDSVTLTPTDPASDATPDVRIRLDL
jgi:hypothetical protein